MALMLVKRPLPNPPPNGDYRVDRLHPLAANMVFFASYLDGCGRTNLVDGENPCKIRV